MSATFVLMLLHPSIHPRHIVREYPEVRDQVDVANASDRVCPAVRDQVDAKTTIVDSSRGRC